MGGGRPPPRREGGGIFKKNNVVRESNPGPLRLKLLPYQLSHRGVVNKIKFIHGATHISFAKFLVAPKHSLGATLHITISVCLCRHFLQNLEKYVGIELQMSEQDCSSNDRACASYPRFEGSSLRVNILF